MKNPSPILLPSVRYRRRATVFVLLSLAITGISIYLNFNPLLLFTEFHYVRDLIGEMLPPNFSILWTNKTILGSVGQTLAMAFLGTLAGGTIAICMAFLAASNTMPLKLVRIFVRALLALERIIPVLVTVLLFVIAVGLGPFAGVLTITVTTVGTFGKLFTEAIENAEHAPAEAIFSVGATRWQVAHFSILPQVLPSFIANFLYAFDINLRVAIGLGIFGAGGIGLQLYMAMKVLHYPDALALLCVSTALIMLTEKLSDHLRKKIL